VLRNCVKKRNRPFNDKDMLSAAGPSSAPVADANDDDSVGDGSISSHSEEDKEKEKDMGVSVEHKQNCF